MKHRGQQSFETMSTNKTPKHRSVLPVLPKPVYSEPRQKKETIIDYSENSTTHGIYYVCERSGSHISHIFWLIVCLSLGGFSVYLINDAYSNWRNNPVATSVQTTSLPIEEIDYPAITICGLGSIKRNLERAFLIQVVEFLEESRGITNVSLTDNPDVWTLLSEYDNAIDDFFDSKYPGLTQIDPTTLAEFMSLGNPDEALRATAVLFGGDFDPCLGPNVGGGTSRRRKRSTNEGCSDGFVLDETAHKCYLFPDDTSLMDEFSAYEYCMDQYEAPIFTLNSQEDITGLKNLTESGALGSDLKNGMKFWVELYRDDHSGDFLAPDGTKLTSESFQFLDVIVPEDSFEECMTFSYQSQSGKFLAQEADCGSAEGIRLCSDWQYIEPNCSESSVSESTTTSPVEMDGTLLDHILDPAKRLKLDKNVAQQKKFIRDQFKAMDLQKAYPNLFELLWYSQLPCFDVKGFSQRRGELSLLKKCIWKGVNVPCSKIFKTFPTDRGMCCSFNSLVAEEEFKKGIYAETIAKLQQSDQYKHSGELPPSWKKNNEPVSKNGVNKGLTIIMDAHSDKIQSSSVDQDFTGFFAIVNSKGEHPLVNSKSILIRPGHENLVSMNPIKIVGTKRLPSLSTKDRRCFFKSGDQEALKTVEMYSKYSYSSCMLECQIKWGLEQMKLQNRTTCIPWYLPNLNSDNQTRMCDPWNAVLFRKSWSMMNSSYCSMCLPDCETTFYQTSVTSVKFRKCDNRNMGISRFCNLDKFFITYDLPNPPIFGEEVLMEYGEGTEHSAPGNVMDILMSNIRNRTEDDTQELFSEYYKNSYETESDTYNAYEKDIAVVTFYFDSSTAFQYTRAPRMTWTDFMAQVGGLMGLCLGFSFASFIEIIYWLGFRLCFNPLCRTQHSKKM